MASNFGAAGPCLATLATFGLAGAYSQAADIPLAACDSGGFQTVLRATERPFDARAVWLNRRLVKWPGAAASGRFRLYIAPEGGIRAKAGSRVSGAAGSIELDPVTADLPAALATQFKYLGSGLVLSVRDADVAKMPALMRQELVLVQEAREGTVQAATKLQLAGALDDLYASAAGAPDLGVRVDRGNTAFKLWAPLARQVAVCLYATGNSQATAIAPMQADGASGIWSVTRPADFSGKYYKYAIDGLVDGVGLVRNLVTDPYAISLTTDSRRSYVGDLAAPRLQPPGWDRDRAPQTVRAQTDMVVYELHVRDFSSNDRSVRPAWRGKFAAFKETGSNGMKHLRELARAGLTDVHLLPVFDFSSVPEGGCVDPRPSGGPAGDTQQAAVAKTAATDCYNWGYDPFHFGAPEGSYATDPADGARRIVEFREMVHALHAAGLRVGMDVVYNHTAAAGQNEHAVLDRIVPGYYHRRAADGAIAHSTCCDNTATENVMMGKLMVDTAVRWVRAYKIDSFRFDLMGHQPRAVMEEFSKRVDAAAGRHIPLIGEGWNFGEVADGARFVQASQRSLNGSGIGTFSDRGRDAVRGGSSFDSGEALVGNQGFINGLVYDSNARAPHRPPEDLMKTSDMVKLGLAGSLRDYPLETWQDKPVPLEAVDYGGQPAGYASQPGEVVNYVENHDNQTLFDICAFKLPLATTTADRARVQMLGAAIDAFSQGVAYFHAGIDTLRSKSLDRNSYDSGDWFNRIDWTCTDNYFGSGLPPRRDNGKDWAVSKLLLANPAIKPTPADIRFARDAFRDLLRIRASSTVFRLRTADDVKRRLRFYNTGSKQVPTVIVAHLDGRGYPGAAFADLVYLINVDKVAHSVTAAPERAKPYKLHPVHRAPGAADPRACAATYYAATGTFTVPPRTAVVFVD